MNDPKTALERLAERLPGALVGVTLKGGQIHVDGEAVYKVPVPEKGKSGASHWMRHDAPGVWPNTPHGETRQILLFGIVKDAARMEGDRPLSGELQRALVEQVEADTEEKRHALAAAMSAKFWTGADTHSGSKADRRRYLVPLHAILPVGFEQEKAKGGKTTFGYKMFRGTVLPFLLSDASGQPDTALLERFLNVFTSEDDLTRLDKKVLEIAKSLAPDASAPDVSFLLEGSAEVLESLNEAGGGFCQPSLDQFRLDLEQVLELDLPRRDLINQLTNLLALHLSVRLYRAGMVLSLQLDRCLGLFSDLAVTTELGCAGGCAGELGDCSLAGQLRFRTGSGSFRSVKLSDPCVTSYRSMTSRFLLPLPVTITAVNFACDVLHSLGGPRLRSMDVVGLFKALEQDPVLREKFDAVMHLLAIARRYELRGASADIDALAQDGVPGLYAFREALLEGRRNSMRHESRDVVHQLAKEVRSGRLIMSNGRAAVFFELDEDMLHLLVRLVCGRRLTPYREFVAGLLRYGLAPQDGNESELMQSALERLGMLQRYSDASESAYVHHTEASLLGGDI